MSLEYDEYKKDSWKVIVKVLSIVAPACIIKELFHEYILASGVPSICALFAFGLVHIKYTGTVAWGYNYKKPELFKLRMSTVKVIGKGLIGLAIFCLLILLIFATGMA